MPHVKIGDRVRMTGIMPNDPNPLPVGAEGIVTDGPNQAGQIMVKWDESVGRSLILLATDPFAVI